MARILRAVPELMSSASVHFHFDIACLISLLQLPQRYLYILGQHFAADTPSARN
jgi:hypothetical protein